MKLRSQPIKSVPLWERPARHCRPASWVDACRRRVRPAGAWPADESAARGPRSIPAGWTAEAGNRRHRWATRRPGRKRGVAGTEHCRGTRAGRHPGAGGRRRALMRHEGREASGPAGPGGPGYRRPGTRGAAAGYRRVQSRWRRGIAHSRLLRAVPASTRGVFLAGDCATPLDRLISGASEVAKLGCAVHAASRWGKRRGEE
jgi:hypothetical protein